MAEIYRNSGKFKRGNPHCRMYYTTTGRWTQDQTLEARRRAAITDLEATNLFSSVHFDCFGADELQRLYRQSKNAIAREFQFQNRLDLPEIPGVTEAYLGYVPRAQFLSIIKDEDGDDILQNIFYDNVRDWQGFNDVNNEIVDTLKSPHRNRFVLMNNGITIIARSMTHAGSRFTIEDFQVVNGCQTSHAVFMEGDDSVTIPLRLISTENEDIIESIIRATNRQTEVKREQFFAVTEFAKNLEEYCQTFPSDYQLFYERRSRQFDRLNIEKTRIITPANMIRAVAAMFLQEPHRTTRNYARIADQVGTQLFAEGHKLDPYYTAGYTLYKLEYYFRNQRLDPKYKPARYHILLAVRLVANPALLPRFNANEMERYCKVINEKLWDTKQVDDIFSDAIIAVDQVAGGNFERDNIRTEEFTRQLIARCGGPGNAQRK
jgi:hypothetical protein